MPHVRRMERFVLPSPVEATAGAISITLLDVSLNGFKVQHQEQLPPKGEPFTLRFRWNGKPLRLECSTMWTTIHRFARTTSERPTLASGLRIESADASWDRLFETIIASLACDGDPYLFCELVDGTWRQQRTSRREQPGEGFTVSATEEAAQVQRLCAAYASGDGETRKLIRTLAALSLKSQAEDAASGQG